MVNNKNQKKNINLFVFNKNPTYICTMNFNLIPVGNHLL